jgi:hypothetical protein
MDEFLVNISSFPVVIYTVALGVVIGYWLLSLVGLFNLDALNADVEIDTEISDLGAVAGLLTSLGLAGVPITIVISLLFLNGWFVCYFLSKFVPIFPDMLSIVEVIIDIMIIIISFAISIFVSAIMVRPLKRLFKQIHIEPISRSAIGRTCRVRTTRVDESFGEVDCTLQGASLILKVRSFPDISFVKGDFVVLIEHQQETDTFLVVSEESFKKESGL